ncbi:MAG: bifunctional diaminohydroxyphosphoribosylaminopyrimidine deaminase/5-amino-6-(5-phosphoribosylamino)uracil reductase RibD [Balneolales bacterium]|nr:bifunctional diaminohydroxyphosphoribosylaminopyrimidine deaminase/5-amino-6-(5-phosphoribosylamino)uracil reductase RibD [Balneolales bacterium]
MTEPVFSKEDQSFMRRAIILAQKGEGYVSPNPLVGCIIVNRAGKVIGKGYHQKFGKAHAEINALNSVKDKAELKDATVYVTLEPCSHMGKTPPCALALAALPIKRVVVGLKDPNPKVNGAGIKMLREAGIQVDSGLLSDNVAAQNEFFLHYIRHGRPFVSLKIAQTLDGYIAAADGSSQWITGKAARAHVHKLRTRYDGVMVGRNTVMNDNPRLTVRHVEGRQPKRIIIDGPLSIPRSMNIYADQYEEKTVIITHNVEKYSKSADPMLDILNPRRFRGKTLLVSSFEGHTDLDEALEALGSLGIASVLTEPGSNLARAIIRRKLADKLYLFVAPKLLGAGTRSVTGLGINKIDEALELKRISSENIGDDLLITGYF